MVGNDAVDGVDSLGLDYDDKDAAGSAALKEDKQKTYDSDDLDKRTDIQKATRKPKGWYGWEYCGLICKKCVNGKDKYKFTGPRTDNQNGSCNPDLAPCSDGWDKVGEHHSHPDDSIPSQNDHSKIPPGQIGYVGSGSNTGPDYKYEHTRQGKKPSGGGNAPLVYPKQPL